MVNQTSLTLFKIKALRSASLAHHQRFFRMGQRGSVGRLTDGGASWATHEDLGQAPRFATRLLHMPGMPGTEGLIRPSPES
jgi:hypothetical protein